METSLQKLKELMSWMQLSYVVIWKIGPYDGIPVWHQGYFNEFAEAEVGQAQRFESIYRNCRFTPSRPGYAYLAWQQQAPFWWTKPMEPVLTDESKEIFLHQARIQTLVCFPGRAPTDGSGYCIELATTSLIGESDYQLRIFIQEFLDKQIAPYIYGTPTLSSSQTVAGISMEDVTQTISTSAMSNSPEELPLPQLPSAVAMAEVADLNSALLTGITHAAVEPEEAFGDDFDVTIVRPEEPYFPWTHPGGTMATYISTGMTSQGMFFHDTEGGSIPFPQYSNLVNVDIIDQPPYQGLSDHEILSTDAEWANSDALPPIGVQSTLGGNPSGSRKGKEIVDDTGPVTELSPLVMMVPGHSSRSRFQPAHRHAQFLRVVRNNSKRQALIYRWAKHLAPQIQALLPSGEKRGGPGSSSTFEGSPGTDLDPRSLNSVAYERDLAHAHKIAERNRRKEFNKRLQTLISIVPMNNKKDKVSVLTKTIDHIRHLRSRITQLEQVEGAARVEEIWATSLFTSDDVREEDPLGFFNTEGAGPTSSSFSSRPDVVVQRAAGETLVIKVEAHNHSRSLLQLLNVLEELGIGVITVDYSCMSNGRFRANLCVQNSKGSRTIAEGLEATLSRILETGDCLPIGSD